MPPLSPNILDNLFLLQSESAHPKPNACCWFHTWRVPSVKWVYMVDTTWQTALMLLPARDFEQWERGFRLSDKPQGKHILFCSYCLSLCCVVFARQRYRLSFFIHFHSLWTVWHIEQMWRESCATLYTWSQTVAWRRSAVDKGPLQEPFKAI